MHGNSNSATKFTWATSTNDHELFLQQQKQKRVELMKKKLEQREVCASAMMQQQKLNNHDEIHELLCAVLWGC